MSQKALALEAYKELVDNYESRTSNNCGWNTLRTVKVTLFKEGEQSLPPHWGAKDIAAFVDEKVETLMENIKHTNWGITDSMDEQPLFVRACPLIPRAGVLESCAAYSMKEVREVATRIITTMMSPDPSAQPMYDCALIDPYGSVIVQPYIDADASAVVSPNHYIIMGRDNDGITAGKDGLKVTIPVQKCTSTIIDLAELEIDPDLIEIEFVSMVKRDSYPVAHEGNDFSLHDTLRRKYLPQQRTAMVQLRGSDGPRPIGTPPKGVTISGTFHGAERININHIHIVSDNTDEQLDLMEQALREGMPEGSVVLHPNGSHLSHHAGQCFKYGVPYIASTVPKVGEQWTQATLGWVVLDNDGTYEPQPYDPLDFTDEFIKGFNIGFTNFARQHGWLSNHFHQFIGGPIQDPAECAVLAGAHVAWLVNATLSVGFGELRHIPSNTDGSTPLPMATAVAVFGKNSWVEVGSDSELTENRQSWYMNIENNPLTIESVDNLLEYVCDMYELDWSSGYGGAKYHDSCNNALDLLSKVKSFMDNPTKTRFKLMISKANMTENNVHNNGFFFNKFISKTALDWGTDPSRITISPHEFFSIYYAAQDIMSKSPREGKDITPILALANSITLKDLKETPITKMKNIIGESSRYLNAQQRHPSGLYGYHTSSTFLPCGKGLDCLRCSEHTSYHADKKVEKEQQLIQSVTSNLMPTPKSFDAPFPFSDDQVHENAKKTATSFLKSMSKKINDGELVGSIPLAETLAEMFNEGVVTQVAHKYVANIISTFNTEQLTLFSKTKED